MFVEVGTLCNCVVTLLLWQLQFGLTFCCSAAGGERERARQVRENKALLTPAVIIHY
jgi:hypothetical protein